MSCITCYAVDLDGVGLEGMYAQLECYSEDHTTKFESITNAQGCIEDWFVYGQDPIQLGNIDPTQVDHASLTFFTNIYFRQHPTPWVQVQADFDFSTASAHSITLHLGPGGSTYSLRHCALSEPVAPSSDDVNMPALTRVPTPEFPDSCGQPSPWQSPKSSPPELWFSPGTLPDESNPDTPSPLTLPPPMFPDWAFSSTQPDQQERSLAPHIPDRLPVRTLKRKEEFGTAAEPPNKRQRVA